MKKITIIVEDDEPLDFNDVVRNAIEFHIERLPDTSKPIKKKLRFIHRGIDGMTTQKAIMTHYTPEGMFTKLLAQKWMTEQNFAIGSTSPALSYLRKHGFIEQIDDDRYRFVKPLT